jgi:hypothetical protein
MRTKLALLTCLGIFLFACSKAALAETVVLKSFTGDVKVKLSETASWTGAKTGMKLDDSCMIALGKTGTARLETGSGVVVNVEPGSMALVKDILKASKKAQIRVSLRDKLKKKRQDNKFGPTAVAGVRGAEKGQTNQKPKGKNTNMKWQE